MKSSSRAIFILTLLAGYIILQFLWWEVLLVRQNNQNLEEKQKLFEISIANETLLKSEIEKLHSKKIRQTYMIVGEGSVFLLLLLYGIYRVRKSILKETELNQRQKNFFLSITHELKTPIAATKLQLQTLQKQKLSDTLQQEILASAISETDRLNSLIDNVLLANGMESEEFKFHLEKINLSEFLETILTRYFKKNISEGELKLNIQESCYALIDTSAFPSLLINLLDNALKYSFEEKGISVSLKKENQKLILNVADTGIGIAEREREKVFERFYRSGNEETRKTKGTGLGLFIVKYIAQKHKAQIIIKNNSPTGSIFEITFLEAKF